MPAPTVTTLPEAPSIADPANFPAEASAHVASLSTLVTELNAFGDYLDGNGFGAHSASYRNLIINGEMMVAQRGTSTTGITTADYYVADVWRFNLTGLGTWTMTQESDGPDGFANSLKVEVTTADATPAAADIAAIEQRLTGRDLQSLKKGLAAAESVSLQMWVKSNVTGTYQVNIRDIDNTRIIGATYAISASATWEQVTLTFAGDTTGALDNDAANSLTIEWLLDSGSNFTGGAVPTAWEAEVATDRNAGSNVNVGDTNANYWQITGVQLEAGSANTAFEHMEKDGHRHRCLPYYCEATSNDTGGAAFKYASSSSTDYFNGVFAFPVEMIGTPTLSKSGESFTLCTAAGNGDIITAKGCTFRVDTTAAGRYRVTGGTYKFDAGL